MARGFTQLSDAFFADILSHKRSQPVRVRKLDLTDCPRPPRSAGPQAQLKKADIQTTVGEFTLLVKTFAQANSRAALVWQFLQKTGGLPIPEVYQAVHDPRRGHYHVVLEYIEPPPAGHHWDEARCRLVGQALAKVHAPFWGKTDQLPAVFHQGEAIAAPEKIEPTIRRFVDRMSGERYAALAGVVPTAMSFLMKLLRMRPDYFLRPSRLKDTLLHGGLDETEVLFRPHGEGEQAILIDWERSHAGAPVEDVAYLFSQMPGPENAARRHAFLSAYTETLLADGVALDPKVFTDELNRERVLLGGRALPRLCVLYVERKDDEDYRHWCDWFVRAVPANVAELVNLIDEESRAEVPTERI